MNENSSIKDVSISEIVSGINKLIYVLFILGAMLGALFVFLLMDINYANNCESFSDVIDILFEKSGNNMLGIACIIGSSWILFSALRKRTFPEIERRCNEDH